MEMWDVYDAQRQHKGYCVEKGTSMGSGEYHLVVHVCVFDRSGRMLIQKRKLDKPNWPGVWDFSSGGAAIAGEDSSTAAARELREELAVEASPETLRPVVTVHFDEGFDDYYIIELNEETAGRIQFQKAEIDSVRWVTCRELLQLIDEGQCGIRKAFIQLLFDMRKQRGNRT